MELIQIFYVLLGTGILLLSLEIFVPGGVLGAIGGVMIVSTIFMSLFAFEKYGVLIAFLIFILAVAVLILWISVFPKTYLGKRVSLSDTLKTAKSNDDNKDLIGAEGVTLSELRPSGFAKINGKKLDVVTSGNLIEEGKDIIVTNVEGFRIIVKEKSNFVSKDVTQMTQI
jgi:membrane-bound serine protease (ClpP class)